MWWRLNTGGGPTGCGTQIQHENGKGRYCADGSAMRAPTGQATETNRHKKQTAKHAQMLDQVGANRKASKYACSCAGGGKAISGTLLRRLRLCHCVYCVCQRCHKERPQGHQPAGQAGLLVPLWAFL